MSSASAVAPVLRFAPDTVFFLGDLAWASGEDDDYLQWQKVFAPLIADRPAILMPGNHDRRDRMLAHFASDTPADAERAISIVEAPSVRLIGLDSLYRTDVVPGLLGEAQRTWLENFLDAQDQRPTVILVHHHLGDDDYALLDGDRLLQILQSRPQVKCLVTAHRHVYRHHTVGRLHCIAAPALGMPFAPKEPLGWLEATFEETGAALRFRGVQRQADDPQPLRIEWRG